MISATIRAAKAQLNFKQETEMRPLKWILAFALVAAAAANQPAMADVPPYDTTAYYRLTTLWQGECRSLDIINDGIHYQVALRKSANVSGQFWRISPEGNGYVRLTNLWLGSGFSLDILNDGTNSKPVMAQTGRYSGQHWKIVPASNGFVRLTTERQGEGKSLDIVNDGTNDKPRLAPTANFSGQHWRITKETSVTAPPPALGLDAFYKKYLDNEGIPIVSSQKVPDEALYQARSVVRQMLSQIPNVRQELAKRRVRVAIIAASEGTTDIPEHAFLKNDPVTNWDWRARGLGATVTVPVSSGAEENVLCYGVDPFGGEDILMHEFAHAIYEVGLVFSDSAFQGRLNAAFQNARQVGLWTDSYAITNASEYFAEGVQTWFNVNDEAIPADGMHNHVNTRAELQAYDPTLYALLEQYFAADENQCSCH